MLARAELSRRTERKRTCRTGGGQSTQQHLNDWELGHEETPSA